MTTKVFITHSWQDIVFARRLYEDLTRHGLDVWLDDRRIKGGQLIAREINSGLQWCDVYIPILSRAALASKWCDEEINIAIGSNRDKGKPEIVSAVIENVDDVILPSLKYRLYFDFRGDYETALRDLLQKTFGIEFLPRPAQPPSAPPPAAPAPPSRAEVPPEKIPIAPSPAPASGEFLNARQIEAAYHEGLEAFFLADDDHPEFYQAAVERFSKVLAADPQYGDGDARVTEAFNHAGSAQDHHDQSGQ
ncbi:MAG: toll/interleukin-1 receptor domain-containing protein [Chloroflexi bacterium]|nr:toll/interleukin-1 receptor domain-containing protein [Chloroflexota bacterium]